MSLPSQPFDLNSLYCAVDAERLLREMSWSGVARTVGVAPSTIRRFQYADDAEADGVLAVVRWLGCPPEDFITHGSVDGEMLPPGGDDYVRVDMNLVAEVTGDDRPGVRSATRTTIQRLVTVAQLADSPVAKLTKVSRV